VLLKLQEKLHKVEDQQDKLKNNMKNYLKDFKNFSVNEDERFELQEYKVKDVHAAEDKLEDLGIVWTDFINHPDGKGFGRDGDLVAHYDEAEKMLYVHEDVDQYFTRSADEDEDMVDLDI